MSLISSKEEIFFIDGSLRDILIRRTNIADWEGLLSYSFQNADMVSIKIDSEIKMCDKVTATKLFNLRERHTVTLSIVVFGITLNTHFFDENEIELDLDPREVITDVQIEHLEQFLVGLAIQLSKPINFYDENQHITSFYEISVQNTL